MTCALIVEDDRDKRTKIREFLEEMFSLGVEVVEAESLRSGLRHIVSKKAFDFVLLDMSMPSFDINAEEPEGGTPESFAGRDLMEQMKLRSIHIPTIVITQYRTFDSGSVDLDDLKREFVVKFSEFYVGCIYYSSATDTWRDELAEHMKALSDSGV